MPTIAAVCSLGYLLGSIPFGYLAGRANGLDIRLFGSHNIGATNVLRTLGKPWGISVFIADALKGFAAVRVAIWMSADSAPYALPQEFLGIVAAISCVIGHSFPLWLRFKGGKGVATSAGSLFGIIPLAAGAILLVWLIVFRLTRYVSVASISAALALPIAVAAILYTDRQHSVVLLYFSLAMTFLVLWRHRSNFSRLRQGTEPRFSRK